MPIRNIMAELRAGKYRPVYFLQGEEPYYIDLISDFIAAHALSEEEKSFNMAVHYGRDVDPGTIVSEAKRYPMMASRQVVIVKEAQTVRNLIPTGESAKSELLSYFENPQPTTVLVICHKHKKLDTRKKIGKAMKSAIEKNGVFFTSEKVKDWNLSDWIIQHVKMLGYHIDPRTATVLAEYLGNDLSKIDNELSKLFIELEKGGNITADLVEAKIGISKDFNIFELQRAILQRNIQKVMQIIIHFANHQKEHPIQRLLPTLHTFFYRIMLLQYLQKRGRANEAAKVLQVNPYLLKDYQLGARNFPERKLKAIFRYLRETDKRSKGIDDAGTDNGDLMKELMFKVMH